jgi:hypothetical protein
MLKPDLQDFATDASEGAAPPQVFTRAFSVPAGMPWVQVRAAQLEARHGAPLPIDELMHQVRRLGRWSPGAPARFVVFYLRAREFRAPFETSAEVDGQTVMAAFGVAGRQAAQAGRVAVLAAALGSVVALMMLGIGLALHERSEAEDRLVLVEQRLTAKDHAARNLQRQTDQAQALHRTMGGAKPIDEVLGDLSWASSAKAAEARIVAVHWDHGLLAVEARGEVAPFAAANRPMERSPKPIRPGVWLWGVRPSQSPGDPTSEAKP